MPAFSFEDEAVKDEVKRVKLEAKQRVEKIKADAKAAKIKAKEDAKQAKIDAKNAEINAIKEAKRAKKEAEFNSKLNDIQTANDAKKAELNAVAKAKKDRIDAELNAEISKIDEENNAKIAALRAKYEGKKPAETEKAVRAKRADIKDKKEENIKPAVDLKPAKASQNEAEADTRALKTSELKPRAAERKPVTYTGVNFETKKTEIMAELNLSEKQAANAEKLYAKNKEEIALLNIEMENTQKELKMLKKANSSADTDLKANSRQIATLEEKMSSLLQERDSVHNEAMKKFDSILDKEQKETWLSIKNNGGRLFPDIEQIR